MIFPSCNSWYSRILIMHGIEKRQLQRFARDFAHFGIQKSLTKNEREEEVLSWMPEMSGEQVTEHQRNTTDEITEANRTSMTICDPGLRRSVATLLEVPKFVSVGGYWFIQHVCRPREALPRSQDQFTSWFCGKHETFWRTRDSPDGQWFPIYFKTIQRSSGIAAH